MPFSNAVKEEVLVKSRRCCCICNEFAGVYSNVHHIVPEDQNGPSTIENAIVLCLRCHGEAGHYNNRHPIGNKYSPTELIRHRDYWWKWCENNPGVPLPKNPVSVSPSLFGLGNNEWRTKSLLNVYNKENRFYYQVWIKICIESEEIQPEQIGIELVSGHNDLKLRAGLVEISASIFRMDCIDASGKKAAFLVINSLQPNATYTFEISRLPSVEVSSAKGYLRFAICDFKDEPTESGEGANKAFFNFIPPEDVQIRTLGVLLRRIPKS